VVLSVLWFLFIILCLFVTTTIAIKGTLPIASRRLTRTIAMTQMREDVDASPLEEGASAQEVEMPQERSSAPQVTTNGGESVSSNISSQLAHGITIAHGHLVETWKVWVLILPQRVMDLSRSCLIFFK